MSKKGDEYSTKGEH